MHSIFQNSHAGSWLVLIFLFILTCLFKGQKFTLILQRLFYVIMLVSGIGMLVIMEFPMKYVVKGIAAIVLIGIMEVIVGRKAKNKKVGWLWAVFAAAILIIILIGYGVLQF